MVAREERGRDVGWGATGWDALGIAPVIGGETVGFGSGGHPGLRPPLFRGVIKAKREGAAQRREASTRPHTTTMTSTQSPRSHYPQDPRGGWKSRSPTAPRRLARSPSRTRALPDFWDENRLTIALQPRGDIGDVLSAQSKRSWIVHERTFEGMLLLDAVLWHELC